MSSTNIKNVAVVGVSRNAKSLDNEARLIHLNIGVRHDWCIYREGASRDRLSCDCPNPR